MVLAKKKFKERYNNHTASFRKKVHYISLQWTLAHPYTCGTRKCDLCLTEKLAIIKADPESLLNMREEFVSKCRHINKFTLRFFKKK